MNPSGVNFRWRAESEMENVLQYYTVNSVEPGTKKIKWNQPILFIKNDSSHNIKVLLIVAGFPN